MQALVSYVRVRFFITRYTISSPFSSLLATTWYHPKICYCGIEPTSLVPLGYHGTFFYSCLANHGAVSKPHPTEGDEIFAGCRIPGCCGVCRAVCTPLCRGRCAAYLCCLQFFCCRDFVFSNVHDMVVLRNKQKLVRAHPSTRCTAYNPCVPCL